MKNNAETFRFPFPRDLRVTVCGDINVAYTSGCAYFCVTKFLKIQMPCGVTSKA